MDETRSEPTARHHCCGDDVNTITPAMLGPDEEIADRLRIALTAAMDAGRVAMTLFGSRGLHIEHKHDGTPVTEADRQAELAIRSTILREFPSDGIHGEEFGVVEGSSRFSWLIDPIDGTISYARSVPLWGTLIAVTKRDTGTGASSVVAGVIHMPAMGGESVFAAVGGGAWHVLPSWAVDNRSATVIPARVSNIDDPAHGVLLLTGAETVGGRRVHEGVSRLADRFGIVRGWSDCYAHLLVATGRAEACVEPMVSPWDIAPALVIVTEAGGTCTTFEKKSILTRGPYLITNTGTFAVAMSLVRPV